MTDIGHIYTDEEEKNKSKAYWDFSSGFPVPKTNFHCPVCNSNEPYIELNYYRYSDETQDYLAFIPTLHPLIFRLPKYLNLYLTW